MTSKRQDVLAEPEFLTRHQLIQTDQLGPDWSACNLRVGFWKKRARIL